jgi:hypothetical protein
MIAIFMLRPLPSVRQIRIRLLTAPESFDRACAIPAAPAAAAAVAASFNLEDSILKVKPLSAKFDEHPYTP